MTISLIAAMGVNRQIGKDNKMLWHISEDFKLFKKITMGKTILMGRKTFDSIGRPLPGRTTIVLTNNKSWNYKDVYTVHSLEEAFLLAKKLKISKELIVCGGGRIYEMALPYISKMYLSLVDFNGEADTFFPEYHDLFFVEKKRCHYEETEKSLSWDFIELERSL